MVEQVQVQVRVPKQSVNEIDYLIKEGQFSSRSDAIKTMITAYIEREKTREFYKLINKRSRQAKKKSDKLIPISEI